MIYGKEPIQNGKNNLESESESEMQRRQRVLRMQVQKTQNFYERWIQELRQAQEPHLAQDVQKKYEMKWIQLMQEFQQKLQIPWNQLEQAPSQKVEVWQKAKLPQNNEVSQQSKPQKKNEVNQQLDSQQKVEICQNPRLRQKDEVQQKREVQQQSERQVKIDEKKRDDFHAAVAQHQNEDVQQEKQNQQVDGIREKFQVPENANERKRQIQQELQECSKAIRDIQRAIKETYQFKPCRQLCEVLVNIRQNVYKKAEDIQEDLEYVIEAFGIEEFVSKTGDIFEAKCHDQVYSNIQDARGKEIDRVYSSGFRMDGEVIMKAQVSVKQQVHGGKL